MTILLECLLRSLLREVSVDVADIVCAADWRDVRRRYLSGFKLCPVYSFKEGVGLDFVNTETINRIALQKATKQISCFCREAWQDVYVLFGNTFQNLMSALVPLHSLLLKGVYSADHLIEEHTEAPPIDTKTMSS